MDRPLDSRHARLLNPVLKALPGVLAIYVYGSSVRAEEHRESDLDLALLLPRAATPSAPELAQLQGDLESLAGMPVEISVLSLETQVVHCKEVITTGNRIYVSDLGAVEEFEMRALASYARLCEDRAPVIKEYSIHG